MISLPQHVIDALTAPIRQYVVKIEWLDWNENFVGDYTADVIDGNITIDVSRDVRRTFTMTINNAKGLYIPYGARTNMGVKVRIKHGIKTSQGDYFWNRGIFVLTDPEAIHKGSEKTVTLQGVDKWALLNGDLAGTLTDTTVIPIGTNVADAIRAVAADAGEFKFAFDTCTVTTPYTITKEPGTTRAELIKELALIPSWDIYYDVEGYLRFTPLIDPLQKQVVISLVGDNIGQGAFSRSSVAYTSAGTQVRPNVPRFEPGKFAQAQKVEEGTTNSAPKIFSSSGALIFQFFPEGGGDATVSYDSGAPNPIAGRVGAEKATSTNGGQIIARNMGSGLTSLTYNTSSIFVRGSGQVRMIHHQVDNGSGGATMLIGPWITLSSDYVRISLTSKLATGYAYQNVLLQLYPGTTVWYDAAQYEKSKAYATSFVEGGAPNLCPNPSVETDLTGWVAAYRCSIARDNTYAKFGSYSCKVTTASPGALFFVTIGGQQFNPVSANTTYTVSAYVRPYQGHTISARLDVVYWDANKTYITEAGVTGYSKVGSGAWERLVGTFTTPANAAYVELRLRGSATTGDGVIIHVDGVMLQVGAYATSYIDTTRSPESLVIPTAGVLNPQEGTIECWVYVNDVIKRADRVLRVIWYALPVGGTANGWLVLDHFGDSANWRIGVKNGSTTANYSISDSYTPNGWHFFSLSYNKSDGSIRLLIDGVLRFSTTGAPLPSSYDKLFVGLAQEGTRHCNTLIDDLRISSKARTDAEIAAAYASNQPLPVDEWTTCKMSFDGHLQPTIRKFGLWLASGEIGVGTTIAGTAASNLETKTGAQARVDSHNALESPHNLPSYTKMQSDGFKVFDNLNQLRCHLGQYAAGKYGLKVINGEIYSSLISTRNPGEVKAFAEITPDGEIIIYDLTAALSLKLSGLSGQGRIDWYLNAINYASSMIDAGTNKALWFRTNRSDTGIRLDAYSGPEIDVAPGGAQRIKLNTSLGNIEVTNPLTLRANYITMDAKSVANTDVTVWGDLHVTGTLSAGGSKPARQITPNYGERYLYARESPDVRYVIEGKAQMTNGECRIELDPIFLECIEPNSDTTPWLIHLTPMADVSLYVAEIGANYIVVKESTATSNDAFFWSLSAIRKGYAGVWLEQPKSDEDVLTSNWEDELGVVIDEEPESNMG